MKILVTGGAGFIASHITDAYVAKGHQVAIVDNLSSGQESNINPKAEFHNIDINDQNLKDVINQFNPDIINHHAAQINVRASIEDPSFDAKVNIIGLLNLLEAAKSNQNVKKIILASTGGAIYGDADQVPTTEEYPAWPISPYGIAKLTSEHYLHYYKEVFNLPFVSLRYANVYGPRQNPHGEAGVVAIFYQRILSGQEFVINGEGNQTRDFVFVEDVVEANIAALDPNLTGIFNIGTSIETSVNQLVQNLKQSINHQQQIKHGPAKKGEQKRSSLSYKKANQTFNWEPKVKLAQGLEKTAKFFQNQPK